MTAGITERARGAPVRPGIVLFIDDEPFVRDVAQRALRGAGLSVLVAGNGSEALELFRNHREAVGLVVLDLIMPGLDGRGTLQALKRLRPDVKVLLTSGHPDGERVARAAAGELLGYLPKPYHLEALLDRVTAALREPVPC